MWQGFNFAGDNRVLHVLSVTVSHFYQMARLGRFVLRNCVRNYNQVCAHSKVCGTPRSSRLLGQISIFSFALVFEFASRLAWEPEEMYVYVVPIDLNP